MLDDFGLKPLPPSGPADLYDVIDRRYERGSIILTSNRAPGEWPDLFSDPLLASAGPRPLAASGDGGHDYRGRYRLAMPTAASAASAASAATAPKGKEDLPATT